VRGARGALRPPYDETASTSIPVTAPPNFREIRVFRLAVMMFFVLSGYVIRLTNRRRISADEVRLIFADGLGDFIFLAVCSVGWRCRAVVRIVGNIFFLQNEAPGNPFPIALLRGNAKLESSLRGGYYLAFIAVWWVRPKPHCVRRTVALGALASLWRVTSLWLGVLACGSFWLAVYLSPGRLPEKRRRVIQLVGQRRAPWFCRTVCEFTSSALCSPRRICRKLGVPVCCSSTWIRFLSCCGFPSRDPTENPVAAISGNISWCWPLPISLGGCFAAPLPIKKAFLRGLNRLVGAAPLESFARVLATLAPVRGNLRMGSTRLARRCSITRTLSPAWSGHWWTYAGRRGTLARSDIHRSRGLPNVVISHLELDEAPVPPPCPTV